MTGLLIRLLRRGDLVAKILPHLLRACAEGKLGPTAAKVYWTAEGLAPITGAILMGVGTGLEAIASSYPEWTWAPTAARAIFWMGLAGSSLGLVDAGVRSPWPKGTKIPPEAKR